MLRMPDTFVVENPRSIEDALKLLESYGDSARIVAGGTDLLPNIKNGLHTPSVLVNLKSVEGLRTIEESEERITIGALVSITALSRSSLVRERLPSLSSAASQVAGPQVRNMGTVGGNVCLDTRCVYINQSHFWRSALGYCLKKDGTACHVVVNGKRCVAAASNDTAPVLMTLGAELRIVSPRGERRSSLEDFYVNDGAKNNALAPDEILASISIPSPSSYRVMGYQKLRIRGAIDFPMLNVAFALNYREGHIDDMDVVYSAIAARPRRVNGMPSGPYDAAFMSAAKALAFKRVRPLTNINGDVTWRREMAPVLLERAIVDALGPIS